ncbi:hypothetical protein IEQ34_005761 [Dendrobium chrysotoxum]|uniref:Uncharacterized protein n=1 Tax=Dendrobium chrysotoxum TaxID=161865 RepID=A0AAV7HCB9_DENCH|nr:hypothetical protein IEQ34_005761 [Dendrobium chrysotoxum]
MSVKKMEALEGEMEQFKTSLEKFSTMGERFSYMKNRMENRFKRVEEMLRRILEMKTNTSLVVPMANPNQDLIGIPLAESKGKEIGQEEFDEGSFFHQEPPPVALIRGGSGFLDGGTTERAFRGEGGGVADPYERSFGQGKWTTEGGG